MMDSPTPRHVCKAHASEPSATIPVGNRHLWLHRSRSLLLMLEHGAGDGASPFVLAYLTKTPHEENDLTECEQC